MAGTSLIALIDDIAAIMDDVAAQTKVAAVKTGGVVGDDLALSADQVNGVKPERELPIIWQIAKGSMKNKAILIPAALGISAVAPSIIPLLLVAGGTYLVYEGGEKIVEKLFHNKHENHSENALEKQHLTKEDHDKIEKEKISGAIKTDLVLSGEIIVIALGATAGASLAVQALTLTGIGVGLTVGVYGVVAGIVKADDIGLHLMKKKDSPIQNWIGEKLVNGMPKFMKGLSVVGTAAMFTVGGGILAHNIPAVHHLVEVLPQALTSSGLGAMAVEAGVGIVGGLAAVGAMHFKEPVMNAISPVTNFVMGVKNKFFPTESEEKEIKLEKKKEAVNQVELKQEKKLEKNFEEEKVDVKPEFKKQGVEQVVLTSATNIDSRIKNFQSIVESKENTNYNSNVIADELNKIREEKPSEVNAKIDNLNKEEVVARMRNAKPMVEGVKSINSLTYR